MINGLPYRTESKNAPKFLSILLFLLSNLTNGTNNKSAVSKYKSNSSKSINWFALFTYWLKPILSKLCKSVVVIIVCICFFWLFAIFFNVDIIFFPLFKSIVAKRSSKSSVGCSLVVSFIYINSVNFNITKNILCSPCEPKLLIGLLFQ